MPSFLIIFLLLFVLLAFCVPQVAAFGAGNIPSFAYLEGKAFRHGDIEDTLQELIKKSSSAGGGFAIGALLSKGSKFGGLDIKRVYFGNWLRDYSQAVDIAGLKKLPLQTIINLCMALGFLAHGYATNEFEVTQERLGVYLPTEHIDNPKGYGEGEDARSYDSRLRGPVDPRELEIDPRTGMKNYIANESGHWDTSKALVRRTLEKCIHLGRMHRSQGRKEDEYEAYRLLGQALHTLEDFSAHSNFCELALVALGHHQVFVHVGDHVRIRTPHGKSVAPLITGTFGGSDFIHSLLGEATDHIASVSDLNKELSSARNKSISRGGDSSSTLRDLFMTIPGGGGGEMSREMASVEQIRAGPAAGGKRPEDMSPQELHAVLWQVLSFRDSVVKKIEKTIEKIPGLGSLIEKLMDSIAVFVYTTLEPFLKPLLQTASTQLASSSAEVIDNNDQYEVFNDPRASDPTHSFLSKDHFNLILNEPAGQLAKIIVAHTVKLVVKAWDDTSVNVRAVTEDVLACLFHPDFHDSRSQVQREMMQYMQTWLSSHGGQQHNVIERLTKDAVRNHRNIRASGDSSGPAYVGGVGHNYGVEAQGKIQGYLNQVPGVSQATSLMNTFGAGKGDRREATDYPTNETYQSQAAGYAPSVATTGEAASFYGSSSASRPVHDLQTPHHRQGAPPAFPDPPSHSFPGAAPTPSFPDTSTPSFPSTHISHSHSGGGGYDSPAYPPPHPGPSGVYTPSYAPPSSGSSYGAPSGPPPGGPHYGAPAGPPPGGPAYGAPPGPPPGFPSASSFPSGPSFPGSPPYGEQSVYPPPAGYPPPSGYNNDSNYGGPQGNGW
ncbi:Het-C-domain-containing protein [Hysterangium stoloniferum]|nr:Het-C-domain-containing protein [Hysterangium stoloniferum]